MKMYPLLCFSVVYGHNVQCPDLHFFNCIYFCGRVINCQVPGTRTMLLCLPHWARSLSLSVEATFCQNRHQPQPLLRGNVICVYHQTTRVRVRSTDSQKSNQKKAQKKDYLQLPAAPQVISTVFLSHYSLHCIRLSHLRDDRHHH